jgi:TRAP-type uncharacterized transport system fused permease subunit
VPILDLLFSALAVAAAIYLPLLPPEIVSERVGNPSQSDVLMGTALLLLTLEATRRSVGPTLPIIGILFIAFAYFGPWMPGALKQSDVSSHSSDSTIHLWTPCPVHSVGFIGEGIN